MTQTKGARDAQDRVQSLITLRDVLEVAPSCAEGTRNFYAGLTPKVGKKVRQVLEERAAEQQRDEMRMTLFARPDIAPQLKVAIATPASDGRFSDAVQVPELGEPPDDRTVLQHAMGREHLGMEHCRNLADGAQAGPVKDLFGYLANEETKHKADLEQVHYETVHSGGV